jgi:tetratricopeptide (TPR) repeat protein
MTEYNRRFNDSDPCWLIKVDAHISGPFSFNEILSKLTTGALAPHHEAISPLDRWRPIQSQPLFVAAVEKLRRHQEEAIEHTLTRTERSQLTKTMDLTNNTLTPRQDTLTPPPVFTPTPPSPHMETNDRGAQKPEADRQKLIFLSLGIVVFVGSIFYYILQNKSVTPVAEKKADFITYFDQGLNHKKLAHWSEALKNFSLAHQLNARDVDVVLEMAPLLIQLDGQTQQARSLIEKALVGQYKKESLSVGRNILGLAHSYEAQQQPQSYSAALKYFNESLQADPESEYIPALINKGWLLTNNSRYREAETALLKTISKNPYSNTGILYLIESYVLQGSKENNKLTLQKAQQLTSQMIGHKLYDGMQEIYLFHAYLLLKLGADKFTVQSFLQNALMTDPDLTSDHVHSPLIDWRGYHWKQFQFVCDDLSKAASPEQLPLLHFICKYKAQGVLAAQQSIDSWMAKAQKDPRVYVASAIVSQSVGELEKARESLVLASQLGAQDKLYFQILAKVCLKLQDVRCLKEISSTLLKISPLHGYAALVITQGDSQSLAKGFKESANYVPLLMLQK